jgi:hypothetical protein
MHGISVHLQQNMGRDVEDSVDTMGLTSPSLSSPSPSHFTEYLPQNDSEFDGKTPIIPTVPL